MAEILRPDWPAPPGVCAVQTLRTGGCSPAPWASCNLGDHVGDMPERVAANRASLRALLPNEPCWLRQVHGTTVVDAAVAAGEPEADAAFTRQPGAVCAVMTADCLPVLLCDRAGSVVAAAHAGWRGLAAGVLEATVAAMHAAPGELLAWFGPAIGPRHFEVGDDVRAAFVAHDPAAATAFVALGGGKWLADIYALARRRLAAIGVTATFGGNHCTVDEAGSFFSYRRDGTTGRMATLIWLVPLGQVGDCRIRRIERLGGMLPWFLRQRSGRTVALGLLGYHFLEFSPLAPHFAAGEIDDQATGQGAVEQERNQAGDEARFVGSNQDGDVQPSDDDDQGKWHAGIVRAKLVAARLAPVRHSAGRERPCIRFMH